jgi:hypothetical protein
LGIWSREPVRSGQGPGDDAQWRAMEHPVYDCYGPSGEKLLQPFAVLSASVRVPTSLARKSQAAVREQGLGFGP